MTTVGKRALPRRATSHRATGRWAAGALSTIATAALLALTSSPAIAGTDFYQAPAGLQCGDGDVIRSEPADVFLDSAKAVRVPASATRVLYCSRDAQGKRVAVSGTVLVPRTPWAGPGQRPVVSYAFGTVGLADQCAPSRQMADGTLAELPLPVALVAAGYVVTMTDYEGLGTPGEHTYLIRKAEGRAVLDAARAAQRLPGSGVPKAGPVVLWGASQGGTASAAAGELQASYAPELNVKATYAALIPGDLKATMRALEGTPNASIILMVAQGLRAAYPGIGSKLDSIFNAKGRALLQTVSQECVSNAAVQAVSDTSTLTNDGKTVTSHLIASFGPLLDEQKDGTVRPTAPIYSVHSTLDDLVPYAVGRDVSRRWCSLGATVQFDTEATPNHQSSGVEGGARALAYVGQRLLGVPAPTNCGTF